MTPLDIKIELMKANVTQAQIARECDVSRFQVCRVINDPNSVSAHVRERIAHHIGRDVADVWPDYYLRRAS